MILPVEEKLKSVPDRPGVYFFKNGEGTILYVGKALSLRKRVQSYFPALTASAGKQRRPPGGKLSLLVQQVADLDWIVTGSEAEALLFECSLIKENQPKYNVSLRDDKSYPYLKITLEEEFPRLFIGRGTGEAGIKTIGPFANAALLHQAFRAIRQVIPFRTCRTMPKRACLDYHLRLCSAPCEGKISRADYQQNLSSIFRLMEGRKQEVLDELQRKMQDAARDRRYEDAARFRDQVAGLQQLNPRPRQFIPAKALADLQSVLRLKKIPRRIEGFDISNIFGREAVGSLVAFCDGRPWREGYRRFKIKTVPGIDDYSMMKEIVRRRLERCQGLSPKGTVPGLSLSPKGTVPGRKEPLPDLIVIDGGRGHLNAALEVLRDLKLDLPAVGIAKEFEQLFLPGQREPIALPPQSSALQLLQRVRDEAHRFAIGYHRLLRGKRTLHSALDDIPGIGGRKKQDLLVRFGSVEAIRRASQEDLAQVRGVSALLAERILRELRPGH